MKKAVLLLLFANAVWVCAFTAADDAVQIAVPAGWPRPAYDFGNARSDGGGNAPQGAFILSKAQIALGRTLFFDPRLSRDATISCASCHLPQTAFTHVDHDLSHGIENRIGTRNSPALMNLAWSTSFMWDGAVHHLDVQSLAPIANHDEMDETIGNVVSKLQRTAEYPALYAAAFRDTAITGARTLKALSQFMLTLISADSKYDKVQRRETVFNEWEARGYALFRANCASCHKEPLFTSGGFENNGLPVDTTLNDAGRMKVTGRESDRGKFKVPTLRNVEVSYPYMHDGRFRNLQMVLFHYNKGIHQSRTLAPQLKKSIALSEDEKHDLIAFLKALTDEAFLHNEAFNPPKAEIVGR